MEGGADTDALTIYGNLLLKRLYPDEAIQAYQRSVYLSYFRRSLSNLVTQFVSALRTCLLACMVCHACAHPPTHPSRSPIHPPTHPPTHVNSALAQQPGLYNVWFNLANAYLKLGKKEEAIAALKRTLALNPDVTAAR